MQNKFLSAVLHECTIVALIIGSHQSEPFGLLKARNKNLLKDLFAWAAQIKSAFWETLAAPLIIRQLLCSIQSLQLVEAVAS